MSRSYKRYPLLIQEEEWLTKRNKNKKIRKMNLSYSLKGGQYRKIVPRDSWKYRYSWEQAKMYFNHFEDSLSIEEYYNEWKSDTIRK